jgi:hypothetical protein
MGIMTKAAAATCAAMLVAVPAAAAPVAEITAKGDFALVLDEVHKGMLAEGVVQATAGAGVDLERRGDYEIDGRLDALTDGTDWMPGLSFSRTFSTVLRGTTLAEAMLGLLTSLSGITLDPRDPGVDMDAVADMILDPGPSVTDILGDPEEQLYFGFAWSLSGSGNDKTNGKDDGTTKKPSRPDGDDALSTFYGEFGAGLSTFPFLDEDEMLEAGLGLMEGRYSLSLTVTEAPAPVPLPAGLPLLLGGLGRLTLLRRRRGAAA